MSFRRSTRIVLACVAVAALGWVFTAKRQTGRAFVDPRDQTATMPDPRGRTLFPDAECVAPGREGTRGSPRCVISFGRVLTALGVSPDGTLAITALAHAATVGWILPGATARVLFEPLPAAAEARVILLEEARSRALFAVGSQLWRYDTTTGQVEERIDGPGEMIEDLSSVHDGSLVAMVADGKAFLLRRPRDGARDEGRGEPAALRPLATRTRAVHVALDGSGDQVAVAGDTGEIAIFDLASGDAPRLAAPSSQPAAAMQFAADHLLVAGGDGVLRVLGPDTARETARVDTGSPLVQLAVTADGRRAAPPPRDGVIRVHALPDGNVVAKLSWHQARVAALAFGAGPTLLSADNDGELAVWDIP